MRETVAILDSGSGINLINEDLAHDWGIPLLRDRTKIIFPNQKEVSNNITQELSVELKLHNDEGKIIEKKQELRFMLSKKNSLWVLAWYTYLIRPQDRLQGWKRGLQTQLHRGRNRFDGFIVTVRGS